MKVAKEKVIVKQVAKEASKALENITKVIAKAKDAIEVTKPLKPGACFYLNSLGEDGKTDTGLVLEASTVDKYAPRKTGVYNIGLAKKNRGNRA